MEKRLEISRYALLILLSLVASPFTARAQQPDFQLRIPFHLQAAAKDENGGTRRFGFAGWLVFPDVTARNNNSASLVLGGVFLRYGKKGSWVEPLAGTLINQNGFVDPLIDVRISDNSIPRLNVGAEVAYFLRHERRRVYCLFTADTEVARIGRLPLRVGAESENIYFLGKRDSLGIGPRVVVPLPFKFSHALKKISVATSYQFRNGRNFMRTYLVISF